MDKNLRNNNNKNKLILAVLLLIGIIGIGYAALGANLQINGIADITSATWNVHFVDDSINLTEGSVSITENTEEEAATIDSATEVSYHVKLTNPGDFYEFTVDVTNEGSIDAMIDSISSKIKIGDSEETEIISTGENRNLPSYLNYSVTYSDGVEIAAKQMLNSNATETFKVRVEFSTDIDEEDLPGTNQTLGLKFQVNYVQKDSTAIERPLPLFSEDSWETIVNNVHNNTIPNYYTVGSEKTIDMGSFGTHTLRIANTSTPSECSTTGFSQTACGFVLEFVDNISSQIMDSSMFNNNGWEHTELRTYVNNDVYNALPEILKNSIINTFVLSGHGSNVSNNIISYDKLYLLSTKEVGIVSDIDTLKLETRTLDYYLINNEDSNRIKHGYDSSWWLRSATSYSNSPYLNIDTVGKLSVTEASYPRAVSPAFRLG